MIFKLFPKGKLVKIKSQNRSWREGSFENCILFQKKKELRKTSFKNSHASFSPPLQTLGEFLAVFSCFPNTI